jgi:hypothetical protein
VAGKYFCSQASLFSLAWILLSRSRRLHLETLGIRSRQVPAILKSIARYRKHGRQASADIITLPAFGHLCIRIHRGYKVFNFSELTTTKIFDHDVDENVALHEIKAVGRASPLNFAPTLLRVDPQNRWYTETFLPGQQSLKTEQSDPKAVFDQVIVDHLSAMILLEPIQTTGLLKYYREVRDSLLDQLANSNYDNELRNDIDQFVNRIAARLEATPDGPIHLAFTHGDFAFVNFHQESQKISVIDWESAQTRSVLNDLYNYFLTELYYERTQSSLVTEISDAITLLRRRLNTKAPGLFPNGEISTDAYRWLYYLERIHMLTSRNLSGAGLNVIRRSIEVFSRYESAVSG